jgi:hypothetical protein
MSFFERNSAIIATFLIGIAVLILLHLYGNKNGNGGNTSDASYTLRENFCNLPVNTIHLQSGTYVNIPGQSENLTEAQLTDRCKDICTAMGTDCRWFNYVRENSSLGACLFNANNITDVACSSSAASTGVAKTYIKN